MLFWMTMAVKLRDSFIKSTMLPKQTVDARLPRFCLAARLQGIDHFRFIHVDPRRNLLATDFKDGSLQHGCSASDRMVPIDFAKHDVPGKDHHLSRCTSLVGNR